MSSASRGSIIIPLLLIIIVVVVYFKQRGRYQEDAVRGR